MLIRPGVLTLAFLPLAFLPVPALAEPAFAPGTHGEPFTVQGLMQGCISGDEGAMCIVNAEGWRWIVDVEGPSPPEVFRLLSVLPVNAPIQMTGDILSTGDITAEVAVSDVTAGDDPDARLRALLQGRWTFGSAERQVQIDGSEWSLSVDGQLQSVSLLQLRGDCGDGVATGGTVITLAMMGGDPEAITCYQVQEATLDRITLREAGGAGDLVMARRN